jgi:hypothetical protein
MTRSAIFALALSAAGAALACSEIAAPRRTDIYEWRLFAPKPGGAPGTDTLTFHWPSSDLPVRIWVEDDALELPGRVDRALAAWDQAFLYGEFEGERSADSATAQVIVRSGPAPATGVDFSRRLGSLLAPECRGATDLAIEADNQTLRLPIRIYIDPKFPIETAGVSDCLDLTTIHEIGHALGIFQHSPDPADIMYRDPVVTAPSQRDLETAERLYHVEPTVTTTGR